MLYTASKNGNVIHKSNCPYVKRTLIRNRFYFDSITQAYNNNYHFCKHCCKNNIIENFTDRMENKKITYNISENGNIIFKSPISKWKLVFYGTKAVLYHKNTYYSPTTISNIAGYHYQTDKIKNIHHAINYIIAHDDYRSKNEATYSYFSKDKCPVRIDPYLPKMQSNSSDIDKFNYRTDYYKEISPNIKKRNNNSKKGQKKHKKEKRKANFDANKSNSKRVAFLLNLLSVDN